MRIFPSSLLSKHFFTLASIFLSLLYSTCISFSASAQYLVGAGKYDITGPVAEVEMMGYAKPDQRATGLHMRLFARAFVIKSTTNENRVVFVSADLGHIFTSVKQGVIHKLSLRYGNLYNDNNVMLSATHTHSGPAGYAHEVLYNITSLGFIKDNYDAIVDGIVQAISIAHDHLKPSEIFINRGDILNASKNRSLPAYDNNPHDEKIIYLYPFDTQMTLLRFQNESKEIGSINWFALHPVSMSNLNTLVSPDHKGVASTFFENEKNSQHTNDSNEKFVAAFAQSNAGDVSSNVNNEADDPIVNDFKRTLEAATKQLNTAQKLYNTATEQIMGGIDYRHRYIDFANIEIYDSKTQSKYNTCPAALGYSFAAGTEDGAGASIFHEGDLTPNVFIDAITSIVASPTKEMIRCQNPKPILLALGQIKSPPWVSSILPLQIFKIGSLAIVGVPAEMTTMSGRRVRQAVLDTFQGQVTDVVIAGLSNAYSGYVATPEEYQTQNYEGGFTLYGPQTLNGYIQEFKNLASDLRDGKYNFSKRVPDDLSFSQMTFQTPLLFDDVPPFYSFGETIQQPKDSYQTNQTVKVQFYGGHPKNNFKIGETFLLIEKLENGAWVPIADDNDWNTIYRWERVGVSYSKITIEWNIPAHTLSGQYRIRHFGNYKYGWTGVIYPYQGISKIFRVN